MESRHWVLLLLTAAVGVGIHLLQPILAPFLVGALLAYLGDPVVDRLEARGMGRTAAVAAVFSALILILCLSLLITLPLLIEQLQLLGARLQDGFAWLQQTAIPQLRDKLDLPAQATPLESARAALSQHWDSAGGLLASMWGRITGSGMTLLNWLANVVLIPVVTFYLLRDWDVMVARIRDLLPRRIEPRAAVIARECDEILGAFIRGQFIVMCALGVIYTIGLWIVGLELALVLGLLAGLASIVPYMGFIVGISAAGAAGWFQFQDPWLLLQVGVVFGIGQLLEGMWLTPTLVGEKIGLHPVAVIFALLAGGQLFGFVGVLLALPAAAVVMVMLRHVHDSYKSSELYTAVIEE